MYVTVQHSDFELAQYELRDRQLIHRHRFKHRTGTFCRVGNTLFLLNDCEDIQVWPLDAPDAQPRETTFSGIADISSDGRTLLVLGHDQRIDLVDEQCRVLGSATFEHPIQSINLGEEGTVWIAGGEEVLGGYQVFFSENLGPFRAIPWPAAAVRIWGDKEGIAWTINSREEVWKLHRLGDGHMPGCRREASCRNCRIGMYSGARQLAPRGPMFFVLHDDAVLRGYPGPGASECVLELPHVRRFDAI